jgi:hypothetical protein
MMLRQGLRSEIQGDRCIDCEHIIDLVIAIHQISRPNHCESYSLLSRGPAWLLDLCKVAPSAPRERGGARQAP